MRETQEGVKEIVSIDADGTGGLAVSLLSSVFMVIPRHPGTDPVKDHAYTSGHRFDANIPSSFPR